MSSKKGKRKRRKKIKFNFLETCTKFITIFIVTICLIDIQLSYFLAFSGKEQIAESLSSQIVVTILGVTTAYMIRAYFDTKAEQNNNSKNIKKIANKSLKDKVSDIISDANLPDDMVPVEFADDDTHGDI